MPSKKSAVVKVKLEVIRGFNYVPNGKTEEVRVDVGGILPADITQDQIARLGERGIVRAKAVRNG